MTFDDYIRSFQLICHDFLAPALLLHIQVVSQLVLILGHSAPNMCLYKPLFFVCLFSCLVLPLQVDSQEWDFWVTAFNFLMHGLIALQKACTDSLLHNNPSGCD